MPGRSVGVGPFQGGLNNVSLSGEAQDSEVVELINMEVSEDNSLRSRPPFEYATSTNLDGSTGLWQVLGVYRYTSTEWYVIGVQPTGATTANVIAVLNGNFNGGVTVIKSLTNTAVNKVTAFAQIDDIAYFCVAATSTILGFKWSKTVAVADIVNMPKGNCMISFKSRLWISGVNGSDKSARMYFSTIDTVTYKPDTWATNDYFDVAAGEGGFITALLPLNSSILVFKNDGTWRYSYPSAPKSGQVQKISGSVGAASANSVLEFENYVYVYDQGRVYELVNSTFTHLNRFVKFSLDPNSVYGSAPGVDLSLFNRRIVVRYFNTLYVYSVDTRSWSQWRSFVGIPGKIIELPADSTSTESSVFMAASAGLVQNLGPNTINVFNDAYRSYMSTLVNLAGVGSVSFFGNTMTVNTTSGTTQAWLNNDSGIGNFNIRCGSGQKFRLKGTLTRTGGTIVARINWLLANGSTSGAEITLDIDAVDKTFTAPSNAIAAQLYIKQTGTAVSYTMTSMQFYRDNVTAPANVMTIKDEYRSTPYVVEHIECVVRTKSYDYKAPASHKRMFWWAADMKTSLPVEARLIPVAVKLPPTWGDLQAYTHLQLEQGTWGNPLSFLQAVLDIKDGADPANALTENGRILMKFQKSIRFKQVSFELKLKSHGNERTGPAKIHSLITFVQPKEKVVDRTN